MTATPGLLFDDDQSLYSPICSSAYLSGDQSMLVDYAESANSTIARLKGFDPQRKLVFDFSFATDARCGTAWNAQIVPFEKLQFTS